MEAKHSPFPPDFFRSFFSCCVPATEFFKAKKISPFVKNLLFACLSGLLGHLKNKMFLKYFFVT